jgi:GNAT superfamily N-acetyltransferase
VAFIVRPFSDIDYPAFVEARNRAYGNGWLTVEAARQLVARAGAGRLALRRFVAEDATSSVVGFAQLIGGGPAARYRVDLGVVPAARRIGVGGMLWDTLATALAELDAAIAHTWLGLDEEEGIAFLARRGFVEAQRAWSATLDVAAFDPRPWRDLEARMTSAGVSFTTLAARLAAGDRDEVLRAVHALHNLCRADQPGESRTPIPFEAWLVDEVDAPWALLDGFILARDGGRDVGLTVLDARSGGDPGALHQGFTGVLPDHRGRGLATALKLRAIAYARERGVRTIRTDNSSLNAPMLRVNEKLGFERSGGQVNLELPRVIGPTAAT